MTLSKPPPPGTVAMSEVTSDERQLAARNHGFLTEALRYPTTPIGMHYLLTHYDVPVVEPATWSLEVGGLVEQSVSLTLEEIKSRPAVSRRVTFECAGNGRMALQPRALSQPWGIEAVGTAEWTGTPLRLLLDEVGVSDAAVEVVFAGMDLGIENDIRQRYERSLTLAEALRGEVLLVYAINGQDLPPQHGYPLRLIVPGWYGMTNVKWLSSITAVDQPFEGYQQGHAYRMRSVADERGTALERIRPRALMAPPGIPDYFTRYRSVAAVARGDARTPAGPLRLGRLDVAMGSRARGAPTRLSRGRRRRQPAAAGAGVEPRRLRLQRRSLPQDRRRPDLTDRSTQAVIDSRDSCHPGRASSRAVSRRPASARWASRSARRRDHARSHPPPLPRRRRRTLFPGPSDSRPALCIRKRCGVSPHRRRQVLMVVPRFGIDLEPSRKDSTRRRPNDTSGRTPADT